MPKKKENCEKCNFEATGEPDLFVRGRIFASTITKFVKCKVCGKKDRIIRNATPHEIVINSK